MTACVSCGDRDVRLACELCEAALCAECFHLVSGDVLLCLPCSAVLGPCFLCDGPTGPPMQLLPAEGGGLVVAAAPPPGGAGEPQAMPPPQCPECDELFCASCAPRGECPRCHVALRARRMEEEEAAAETSEGGL